MAFHLLKRRRAFAIKRRNCTDKLMNRIFAASLASLFLFAGCGYPGDRPGESCMGTFCGNGKEAETCCTSDECRYLVSDGAEFLCDGKDCFRAATELADYCQN